MKILILIPSFHLNTLRKEYPFALEATTPEQLEKYRNTEVPVVFAPVTGITPIDYSKLFLDGKTELTTKDFFHYDAVIFQDTAKSICLRKSPALPSYSGEHYGLLEALYELMVRRQTDTDEALPLNVTRELFLDLGYGSYTTPEQISPEEQPHLVLLTKCGLIELRKEGWDLTQLGQRVYNKVSA